MATPTLVTVNGDLAPSIAAKKVTFQVPTLIRYNSGPDVIVPSSSVVTVAADGTFSTQLYGTNDPNWSPANWNYKVVIDGDNLHEYFYCQVPYNAGTLNFSALLPSLTPSQGELYAPVAHGNHVLVLGPADAVPPGTPTNTVIVRKGS